MKVKCIDSSSYGLTLGKEYKVLSESKLLGDSYYQVICDDNSVREFFATRFEVIEEEEEMKEFLNENKRQFRDLTDEEKLLIINEKMKGNVELLGINPEVWSNAGKDSIAFYIAYRTKPTKKLDIPWQFINPKFKWAAMDKNGEIYLYLEKPECKDGYFCSINYMSLVNIDTTGIDWKTSLTQRPEGV